MRVALQVIEVLEGFNMLRISVCNMMTAIVHKGFHVPSAAFHGAQAKQDLSAAKDCLVNLFGILVLYWRTWQQSHLADAASVRVIGECQVPLDI